MVVPRKTRLKFLVVRSSFGCPYLEESNWGRVSQLGHENLSVVRRTTTSVFLVVRRLFLLSRAHGQPNFRTLEVTTIFLYLQILRFYLVGQRDDNIMINDSFNSLHLSTMNNERYERHALLIMVYMHENLQVFRCDWKVDFYKLINDILFNFTHNL